MVFKLTPEYIAGFFDGAGSVGIYARNTDKTKKIRYFVLVVSLAQSGNLGKVILEHLASIFGGSVTKNKSNLINKQMWKWNISADLAYRFLMWFKDYTISKTAEIDHALQFQILSSKRSDNKEAITLATAVKELKRGS